jgi:membrane associated rhomboid family serine protease
MKQHTYFDYRPVWRHHTSLTMVNWIILVNVVVHLVKALSTSPMAIIHLFGLSPKLVLTRGFVWQPLTYMFLHADFWHIFFNMLMTWFLGNTMESVWGRRRFLKYYIACGLGGAAFSAIFTFGGPPVIGASAAVFGLYLAYAMMFPDNTIYLYFLLPIKAKYFVTFFAALQLLFGIAGGGGIAYFAHLGGMAAGLLFFRREIRTSRIWTRIERWYTGRKYDQKLGWKAQETARIDSILDKIASKGFDDLSATERRILENYGRNKQEDSE